MWVVLSLIPIVGGVGLASLTEASFNWFVKSFYLAGYKCSQCMIIYISFNQVYMHILSLHDVLFLYIWNEKVARKQ